MAPIWLTVYQRALQNDPRIREADANRLASRESKPQALAALMPQVEVSGSYNKIDQDRGRIDFTRADATNENSELVPINVTSTSDLKVQTMGPDRCARPCSVGING